MSVSWVLEVNRIPYQLEHISEALAGLTNASVPFDRKLTSKCLVLSTALTEDFHSVNAAATPSLSLPSYPPPGRGVLKLPKTGLASGSSSSCPTRWSSYIDGCPGAY